MLFKLLLFLVYSTLLNYIQSSPLKPLDIFTYISPFRKLPSNHTSNCQSCLDNCKNKNKDDKYLSCSFFYKKTSFQYCELDLIKITLISLFSLLFVTIIIAICYRRTQQKMLKQLIPHPEAQHEKEERKTEVESITLSVLNSNYVRNSVKSTVSLTNNNNTHVYEDCIIYKDDMIIYYEKRKNQVVSAQLNNISVRKEDNINRIKCGICLENKNDNYRFSCACNIVVCDECFFKCLKSETCPFCKAKIVL